MEHPSNPWHVTRNVWMNGTGPQPLPGELFQHGLSRGRFDGDDLVIETSHFTFDPDGMDDHLRMASSVRKKITERYRLIDDTNLRLIITDGQTITLGDVTVTLYITPGHTPGTLSMIIEPLTNRKSVASDDERHVASIWGGTDPSIGRNGVQYYPDGQTMMSTHIESLNRFIDLGMEAGVDVILSPTLSHANMTEKMRYWRMANPDHSSGADVGNRLADEPHPFVGTEAVSRYNQILLNCYEAQLAWRMGS